MKKEIKRIYCKSRERYNKETVVLQTSEGTAFDLGHLKSVWDARIAKYFPHYKILKVKFEKNKGKVRW
jgi:hypothetical protein